MAARQPVSFLPAPAPHWVGDGFRVFPLFADLAFREEVSPFLMLDYAAPHVFPPRETPPGVGAHPHRGFETVTVVYDGEIEHRDSAGNAGTIGPGDVQWMTAGAGLLHEEFHSREQSKRGGLVSMAQLWVNLPAKNKSTPPAYQTILKEQIPLVDLVGGSLRVIAGAYAGAKGPARLFSDLHVWDVELKEGSAMQLDVTSGDTAMIALFSGAIDVAEHKIAQPGLLMFATEGESLVFRVDSKAKMLVLSGKPIGEPIAAQGPFVMNTREEVIQAYRDYQSGQF